MRVLHPNSTVANTNKGSLAICDPQSCLADLVHAHRARLIGMPIPSQYEGLLTTARSRSSEATLASSYTWFEWPSSTANHPDLCEEGHLGHHTPPCRLWCCHRGRSALAMRPAAPRQARGHQL